jgi:hypothetical protein
LDPGEREGMKIGRPLKDWMVVCDNCHTSRNLGMSYWEPDLPEGWKDVVKEYEGSHGRRYTERETHCPECVK